MKLLIFRVLLVFTTLCFIGEDLGRSFGLLAEDCVEMTDKKESKEDKQESEEKKEDKFSESPDEWASLNFSKNVTENTLVCTYWNALSQTHLPIISPPPKVEAA